jgi:hypothetical protein
MRIKHVKRVPYGRDDTPIEFREYQEFLGGPVGCASELREFYIINGEYDKIYCYDKFASKVEQVLTADTEDTVANIIECRPYKHNQDTNYLEGDD